MKGFGDLDEDAREELFKRYEAKREALAKQFRDLDRDWRLLALMRRHAIRQPMNWQCNQAVCNKAQEFGLPLRLVAGMSKAEYINELDHQIEKISNQLDVVSKQLDDYASWKLEPLKNAPRTDKMASNAFLVSMDRADANQDAYHELSAHDFRDSAYVPNSLFPRDFRTPTYRPFRWHGSDWHNYQIAMLKYHPRLRNAWNWLRRVPEDDEDVAVNFGWFFEAKNLVWVPVHEDKLQEYTESHCTRLDSGDPRLYAIVWEENKDEMKKNMLHMFLDVFHAIFVHEIYHAQRYQAADMKFLQKHDQLRDFLNHNHALKSSDERIKLAKQWVTSQAMQDDFYFQYLIQLLSPKKKWVEIGAKMDKIESNEIQCYQQYLDRIINNVTVMVEVHTWRDTIGGEAHENLMRAIDQRAGGRNISLFYVGGDIVQYAEDEVARWCQRGYKPSWIDPCQKLMALHAYTPFWNSHANGMYYPDGDPHEAQPYRWGDCRYRGNYTVWWVKIQSPPIGDWRDKAWPIDDRVEDDSSRDDGEVPTTDTEDTPLVN